MATLMRVRALAPRAAPAPRGLPRRARARQTTFPPKRKERTLSPALRAVFDPNQASHEHGQYKYDQAAAHGQQQATNVYHEPVGASPNQAHAQRRAAQARCFCELAPGGGASAGCGGDHARRTAQARCFCELASTEPGPAAGSGFRSVAERALNVGGRARCTAAT